MARPGFLDHPKFKRLVHILGIPAPHVLGHLEFLWLVAYQNGDPKIGDSTDVELAAQWQGEKGQLCDALCKVKLTNKKRGKYHIHDLFDHAPEYVRKRMVRENARRERGVSISEQRSSAAKQKHANRQQTSANGSNCPPPAASQSANGCTPAPAPAPAPIPNNEANPSDLPSGVTRCEEMAEAEFHVCFAVYPAKDSQERALQAWMDAKLPKTLFPKILSAIKCWSKSIEWAKEGGKYVPSFSNWILDKRWEDPLPPRSERGMTDEEILAQRAKDAAEAAQRVPPPPPPDWIKEMQQ